MGVDAMEVIRKRLEDHERRLAILEKIEAKLAKIDGRDVNNNVIKTGNQKRVNIKKSLSDHIIVLRDHGAFTKPFTAEEVHKKIWSNYPCDFNRVKVELLRLQKRGQLRKTSKLIRKKKYIAYVW
jgi:hypothetical protein